jgi:hypothetical protein
MRRYIGVAVGVALVGAVLSATNAGTAVAQTFKPVMSLIVNTDASAVPVRVVPSGEALVTCAFDLGFIGQGGSPVVSTSGFGGVLLLKCPAGVSTIEVRRIAYAPDLRSTTNLFPRNVVSYRLAVGLVPEGAPEPDLNPFDLLAIVTDGAPEAVLAKPVLLTASGSFPVVSFTLTVSSGIAGINPSMGGFILFRGIPVP